MDRRMTGSRKWRFTSGIQVLSLESTDFWLDYSGQAQDAGADLRVTLKAVWEYVDFDQAAGLTRRVWLEDRLRQVAWESCGLTGTLDIDYGTANARSLSGVVLQGVRIGEASNNALLTYDLEFSYPTGAGTEIARTCYFAGKNLGAQNFLVEYTREDLTEFKPVFRAAAVRVPGGPGLKTIRLTAIKQSVSGATALERRQAAEAAVRDWAWNYKGNQGSLILDGTNDLGTCHLADVQPSALDLPDAVTFELEFITGYGS
jgi:hypothetical protein